jgi:PAS domain S-box-containing protein
MPRHFPGRMQSPLHILMLEDQPADAALINDELRRAGFRFESHRVDTKEAFLRGIEQRKPDVILSDHGLPSFDGMTALMHARRRCPDVPFIFVTGAFGESFAIKMFESGASDYVLKDHLHDLAPVLKRALRRARQRRAEEKEIAGLQRNHEHYRLLVDSVKDYALYMLDPTGKVTTWNAGAEQVEGFTAGEAIGKRLSDLFPNEVSEEELKKILGTAAEEGRFEAEGWRTRKDGSQ